MKNLLFTLITLFTFNTCLSQYSQNKALYDYKSYQYQIGDRYDPTIAGVASFLFPGLGQVMVGETARGVGFFMGYVASTALIFSIDTDLSSTNDNESYRSSQHSKAFIGLGGMLLTWIWSTSDAVRVAKVNNMAWRDK